MKEIFSVLVFLIILTAIWPDEIGHAISTIRDSIVYGATSE